MNTVPTATRRRFLATTGAGAAGLAGAGLAGSHGTASGAARLRVLHGSPTAPAVDVLVDGTRVVTGLSFGQLSSYRSVAPGERSIQVVPAGAPAAESVLTVDVTLEANVDYTAAAVGPVEDLQAALVAGQAPPTPGPDAAAIRVGHLAPDAPAVDVVADGATLASGLEFGSATDYVEVPAGSYAVEVRPAGRREAVATFEVTLAGGTAYSAFAVAGAGAPNDPTAIDLVVAADSPEAGTARVRVVHAIPDAPPVDVFVDGRRVLRSVPFGTVSGYLEVPAGRRTVAVAPAGAPAEEAVLTAQATLVGGTAYTVAAAGTLADPTAFAYVDDLTRVPDMVKLRAVHLSPDAPAVDVVADGSTLVSGLEFGTATDYLTVPPARYGLQVRPAGSDRAVGSRNVNLVADAVYNVLALGFVTPENQPPGFDLDVAIDAPPGEPAMAAGTSTGKAAGTQTANPAGTPTETGDGGGGY